MTDTPDPAGTPGSKAGSRPISLAVIPGDGIGPEVVAEGLKVLTAAAGPAAWATNEYDLGAARWQRTGEVLPDSVLAELAQADAILLGAVGAAPGASDVPSGLLERGLLLKLRFAFDHYVNLRPSRLFPGVPTPLADHVVAGKEIDFVVVREGTEGLYVGNGGVVRTGTQAEIATEVSINTAYGVERVIRDAFDRAARRRGATPRRAIPRRPERSRGGAPCRLRGPRDARLGVRPTRAGGGAGPPRGGADRRDGRPAGSGAARLRNKITLVHKHNVLVHAGGLWRRLFESVAREYPSVTTDYLHVDAATIFLATDPARFDVIVTDNLFGDILTDLAAAVTGGIGLAASGNINPEKAFPSMFEPVHGSAPDIAGRGIADPTATILSVSMLLDHLGLVDEAARVEKAVIADIGRRSGQGARTTSQIGDAIAADV